jgi:hypothetical protein
MKGIMNVSTVIFALFICTTFFNLALHWYTQVVTYPLFSFIGKAEFVDYHLAYQKRLPFSIYIPYSLLMVLNVLLFVYPPPDAGLAVIVTLFILNF